MRKKPATIKIKRVGKYKTNTSLPPKGAPSWCLNQEALIKLNRSTRNIPVYDYNTDEEDIQSSSHDTDNEANSNTKKRKEKKKSKQKGKKHKKSKK